MKVFEKKKIGKTVLVISDLHLGAGTVVGGKRNCLEDFHYDREFMGFIEYYSSNEYAKREVELIINGDFFDLLAVPFVNFFDDEYWSEEASLEKLKIIIKAHQEVMDSLGQFLSKGQKTITYIIGNHDAEFVHPSLRKYLLEQFKEEDRDKFKIILESTEYTPVEGVLLQHGHESEMAHQFYADECLVKDDQGSVYFLPPWGSYYVTRVINKFKEEREYINIVRPIRKAIINGLIYDSLYMVRFLLANAFYFIMVRFISIFKERQSIRDVLSKTINELHVFFDVEDLCGSVFEKRPDIGCLIVGHTHEPLIKTFGDRIYMNTGTWVDMHCLDLGRSRNGPHLTYAQIDVQKDRENSKNPTDGLHMALNSWQGNSSIPYREFF